MLTLDITMSLDGFVAGPRQTLEQPLGEGGERLHEWAVRLATWRERHGLDGGETGADAEIVAESLEATGAVVMGRRMFSGGEGPWEDDPNADGWWGDEPPFRVPVFVLTHHPRERVEKRGGTSFTFVTDGVESALEQARAAAGAPGTGRGQEGDRPGPVPFPSPSPSQDVSLAGGADVAQQYLRAGLLDRMQIHVVPLLLGGGVRLFDGLDTRRPELELERVVASPAVTHLRYRVSGGGGSS